MSNEEQVRSTYAALSDDQLIKIATDEADDLTELGYDILTEELVKRGLFGGDIAFDSSPIDEEEIDYYINILETLPCPNCGENHSYLKARLTRSVVSMVIVTHSNESIIIGCDKCVVKWDRFNRAKTYLVGWWGILGIIKTLQALVSNIRASKVRDRESEGCLANFVVGNIGYLRAYRKDKEKLLNLLRRQNENR